MSSADTTPITAARFAAALQDLSLPLLHLKVREINNAIAKLQYSNDQLLPFTKEQQSAEGITSPPDQDCVEAIAENEGVIERMKERLAIIYIEVVENRGVKWEDLGKSGEEEEEEPKKKTEEEEVMGVNGEGEGGRVSAAWTDGTFQTGTIRNGEVRLDARPGVRGSGGVEEAPEEDGGLHL
ncbi:hypothetical protein ISF_00217 [Cordyceps fumosorosea ARSEF 2679]|uniref:Uncharacterized protein n=1 Tax=Cordyceps fumosorosea (strain ARSEF 2679) TaxID=1081104 RepID=A0A168E2Z5_CORFA|nr:hypothetical protein ISF_00217 [Cordyceps fumosorosea ARSEF 2679]OAA73316.1 hypothetical protein ISF_00217 [Cordyceps fumosorosea ARSEF 2679]